MKSAPSRFFNSFFSKNDENDTASEASKSDDQREAIKQAVAKKFEEAKEKRGAKKEGRKAKRGN